MKSYKHNMGVFLAGDKLRIFYQSWIAPKTKAVVVISHGLGEHSDRYFNIMKTLANQGISFYALDHRGHGKSGGKRGHVDSFMKYIDDLKQFIDTIVKKENTKLPVLLLGHSMGGLIAMKYVLTYKDDIHALILSAPALIPAIKVPFLKEFLGRTLSRLIPRVTLNNELDPADISQDPEVIESYREDPLVHDRVSSRWYSEYLATSKYCRNHASELELPLLVIHGTADKMVNPEGSSLVYQKANSEDKELYTFEGLFHETMNEQPRERKKVLMTIKKWILDHNKPIKKKSK